MNTSNKSIRKEIATFTTSRDKLLAHAHKIACMIVQHSAPKELNSDCAGTGDVTTIVEFARVLPTSWAEQLQAWCLKFTPIRFNLSSGACGFDRGNSSDNIPAYSDRSPEQKLAAWDYEAAMSTPFHQVVKERAAADLMDFDKIVGTVEGLAKRIAKMVKDNKVAPADVPSALAIVEQLSGLKLKRVKPANTEAPAKKKAA